MREGLAATLAARLYPDRFHISHRSLRRALGAVAPMLHGHVIDVGCGDKRYAGLFDGAKSYFGLDLPSTGYGSDAVDIWGDANRLPLRAKCADGVVCTQVLEHVPEPGTLLSELFRVLRPGGRLILTTPQTWGVHAVPHDYYRFTRYGLRYVCERAGFSVLSVVGTSGTWASAVQRAVEALHATLGTHRMTLVRVAALCVVFLAQRAALMVDQLLPYEADPLDHVVVAERPLLLADASSQGACERSASSP